jgi:hypothetical protein
MRAQAAASLSGARVQMVRLAALQILREVEGRPRRVVIDLETLLAEADGIARGLRSGFKPQDAPPARETPMTADEESRLLAEIEDLKRKLAAAMAQTRDEPDEAA